MTEFLYLHGLNYGLSRFLLLLSVPSSTTNMQTEWKMAMGILAIDLSFALKSPGACTVDLILFMLYRY